MLLVHRRLSVLDVPSAEDLESAREKYGKPKTEVQIKNHELFGDLPPDIRHDHKLGEDNPESDPVVKWMLSNPYKVELVEWFQARSETKKKREMSLGEFANYLYDHRNNRSRKKSTWPTVTLPDGRVMGVDYVGDIQPQKEARKETEERGKIPDIDFGQLEPVTVKPQQDEPPIFQGLDSEQPVPDKWFHLWREAHDVRIERIAADALAAEKKRQAIAAQAEELPLETKLLNLAENPEAFAGERTNALAAVERLQRRRQDAQGIVLAS